MKYCIFGGSFDPPHAGHEYVADSAVDALGLDKLLWVPAPDPPHKTRPSTPFRHRLAMVEAAIRGKDRQAASDVEERLPKPSYTINTLAALKDEYGGKHAWYLLIGADNWSIFPEWHRWRDVLKEATVAVFPRRGHPLAALPPGVISLDLPERDVAATGIRAGLAAGGDAAGDAAESLLPAVRAYAAANGLYGLGPVKDVP